jgi:carbon-monoxide dehydrogenase small subunit
MIDSPDSLLRITLRVDGDEISAVVHPRLLLSDFLRSVAGKTCVHVGCEHGVCGICTVIVNGNTMRSCLLFAVQADGQRVDTVASLGTTQQGRRLQRAFVENHGLQCGFCTPAMLVVGADYLANNRANVDEASIRNAISGVLCRCTGYQNIVRAIEAAAAPAEEERTD